MKKTLLILTALIMSFGAFAQTFDFVVADFESDDIDATYSAAANTRTATVVANPVATATAQGEQSLSYTPNNWDQTIKIGTVELPDGYTLADCESISFDAYAEANDWKEILIQIGTDPLWGCGGSPQVLRAGQWGTISVNLTTGVSTIPAGTTVNKTGTKGGTAVYTDANAELTSFDLFVAVGANSANYIIDNVKLVMIEKTPQVPPLVYTVENTGADSPLPTMLPIDECPQIVRLPNPFEFSDGSKVVNSFADWKDRRAEIKAELEHYELGTKPAAGNVSATFSGNTLTVTVEENGETLTLSSTLNIPAGDGPFPIVIGMDNGGLPGANAYDGIIRMGFSSNQISTNSGSKSGAFYNMFPEFAANGNYIAWSWGVSRLIDGLEIVKDQAKVDMSRIGVIGCSYAGKMALFAGAFDERIALTIPQESGGGGVCAWRISETLGAVETLGATNGGWFLTSAVDGIGKAGKVDKLPYDHHELIAMIAPRAVVILGNEGYVWMAEESGYISSMAAREVYKKFGIEDRIGWDFSGGHDHCQAAPSQATAVKAFVDKFLRGDENVDTNILTAPASYANFNSQFWMSDWTDVTEPEVPLDEKWFEAESESCAVIGDDLEIVDDANASNGKYVTVKADLSSASAPAAAGQISIPFITDKNRDFDIYFRMICPSDAEGALWIQVDNGSFVAYDGEDTEGEYKWVKVTTATMLAGAHYIKIGFAKEGIKLDRINIVNDPLQVPTEMGGEETICEPPVKYFTFDFEEGNIEGWTKQNLGAGIDITEEDAHGGQYALKMVNGTATNAWSVQAFTPEVGIVPDNTYEVTFWIRAVDGGGRGRISLAGTGGKLGGDYWADFNVGNEWEQKTFSGLAATGTSVQLSFDLGYVANKTYYVDDIVFNNLDVETGVSKVKTIPDVKIYSPEKGILSVTTLENSDVRVIDLFGRTIKTFNVNKSSDEISINSGIYIVLVNTAGKSYTQKVIVK